MRRFAPQRYFLVLYVYFFGGKGVVKANAAGEVIVIGELDP
ncbi:MAG: hypothetical protein ACK571_07770 [Pseudanabaena sp.]